VFPHDGGTKAGMAWHGPQPRTKQTLTRLERKKDAKDGAARGSPESGSRRP